MAHFMKVKKADVRRIAKEAYRELDYYKNDVNTEKSADNISIGLATDYKTADYMLEELLKDGGGPKRKDGVMLINEIITRPKALKEADTLKFYKAVMDFTGAKLNAVNFYAIIHKDEFSEHMHLSYFAMDKTKRVWSAKAMLTQSFLRSYHKELQSYIDEVLGYHVEIEKDRKTEHLTYTEYKAAMRRERDKKRV